MKNNNIDCIKAQLELLKQEREIAQNHFDNAITDEEKTAAILELKAAELKLSAFFIKQKSYYSA
ncbi:hypothetical protein [Caloramator australicus]|uniref:Uncharacterized protein n=1 Tax=Caloramator australicus RC3 TaxID=857293 RepID=I7J4Q3_9CLOT|nr:hypothetical protein [Caloramator australicus]CCJ32866.1 hypothetical protein CAAU_0782 [Caloramator australicus RC3]